MEKEEEERKEELIQCIENKIKKKRQEVINKAYQNNKAKENKKIGEKN